jgi:hypothetical protein
LVKKTQTARKWRPFDRDGDRIDRGGRCFVLLSRTPDGAGRLKREPVIDVFILATLFSMRLALGTVVTDVRLSPWLFVFSMFLFLSLSAAKRQTEITRMVART